MGKQAKMVKDRTCSHCEVTRLCTAKDLKKHAELCMRAKAAGLILPEQGPALIHKP
jgi:hypothetical protein